MKSNQNRLIAEAKSMMQDLQEASIIDLPTLKSFEADCLSDIKHFSPKKIKTLREAAGVSQPVLAKIMNVSSAAIKQWERGERKPSGASLKLLNLIDQKGIDAIL